MQPICLLRCALGAPACLSILAIATALVAGGCAASSTAPSRVAGPPVPVAGDPPPLPPYSGQSAKVALEADGLPVQLAPRNRTMGADDPREPWSPYYGVAKPGERVDRQPTSMPVYAGAPATTPILKAIPRPVDPDDIIRQAIAAHEMRQR